MGVRGRCSAFKSTAWLSMALLTWSRPATQPPAPAWSAGCCPPRCRRCPQSRRRQPPAAGPPECTCAGLGQRKVVVAGIEKSHLLAGPPECTCAGLFGKQKKGQHGGRQVARGAAVGTQRQLSGCSGDGSGSLPSTQTAETAALPCMAGHAAAKHSQSSRRHTPHQAGHCLVRLGHNGVQRDVVEVCKGVESTAGCTAGVRCTEPGEATRRA